MIEGISQEAQVQSGVAKQVASQMNGIRKVSIRKSGGSAQTARSMQRLAYLAHKLSGSVANLQPPPVGEPGRDA